MKTLLNIIKIIYGVFVVIATFCTLITSIEPLKNLFNWGDLIINFNWYYILPISIIFPIFISFAYWIYHIKKILGIRKTPCSLIRLFKYKNHKNYIDYQKYIHHIYHTKYDTIESIIKHPQYRLKSDEVSKLIDSILQEYQHCLHSLTGVDFSLNIKLFKEDKQKGNYIAYTYRRFPGTLELKGHEEQEIRYRYDNEEFLVCTCKQKDIYKLYDSIKDYIDDGSEYKRNLAYDYALNSQEHFWMSNDLKKDNNAKQFISSSNDYSLFYNSLAVFLISPPMRTRSDKKNIAGLFIVDSIKTNVFISKESKMLIGLLSHMLYEIISILVEREYEREKKEQ